MHDFGGGARSALRAGVVYGAFCLGCCGVLMTVLVVVGLMNLFWMAIRLLSCLPLFRIVGLTRQRGVALPHGRQHGTTSPGVRAALQLAPLPDLCQRR